MKLRRALCLCLGLSATAACGGDANHATPEPEPDAGMDASADASRDGTVVYDPDGGGIVPKDGSVTIAARASRIVSVPPTFVVAGDTYRYRVKSSTKSAGLEVADAPMGMDVRGNIVRWTPTADQAGAHTVTVRSLGSQAAASAASQEITLNVASSTLRASDDVDPDQGGGVYSDNPQSARMLGAGVYVPPRSISAASRMTVSELDQAPSTPNAAGRASAVRFGPEGQTFDAPARVTLPLPEAATHASARTNVFVYQPLSGRWQRVPSVAIDLVNNLVTARVQHFSVYAAIESALDLQVELAPTTPTSACAGGLLARAWVDSPLSDVELDSLNNLPDAVRAKVAGTSILDLLTTPGFTGSVRMVQVFELVQVAGDSEIVRDTQVMATTLYVAADGTADVTHTDALGNVVAKQHYAQPLLQADDIAARMRGLATTASFGQMPTGEIGLGARLHLIYFADDASAEPINLDDLGMAAVERAPVLAYVSPPTVSDEDCDGVVGSYDASDDRLVASIEASPRTVSNILSGDSVQLFASVVHGDASDVSWTLIAGDDGALAIGPNGSRFFTGSAAGRYLVSYRANVGAQTLEHIFAIDVAQAPIDNTPPTCRLVRDIDIGRLGEAFPITAVLADAETETSALRLQWGLLDGESDALVPAATIRAYGEKALFTALEAGNFQIGCRAFDGVTWGPVGRIGLSVVPREQNRAPTDLTLSPAVALLKLREQVTLKASAKDPDGDPLLFSWYIDGVPTTAAQMSGNESTLVYTASKEGTIDVQVEVNDPSSPRITTSARLVVGTTSTTPVDVDMDGWNAGTGTAADCNDNDAAIHPGADEACGADFDMNCDGVIKRDDCDNDGWYAANGDCDDTDPAVHAGARELCDGVDNDCNASVDEGFYVGTACRTGVGACLSTGVLACSSDELSSLCSAKPLPASPEICDGVDNDCDGLTDDGVCAAPDAGVPPDASTMTTFDAQVVGCAPVPEDCNDGIDNDCDGATDAKDTDCQIIAADNCSNAGRVELGVPMSGNFTGAKPDIRSSCFDGEVDFVYAFTVKTAGQYDLTYDAAAPFAWSIQGGSCDATKVSLSELSCNKPPSLDPGNYFLVIEGASDGGPFTFTFDLLKIY